MDTLFLIFVYIITTIILQAIGFAVSRIVDYQFPAAGLLTFLLLFISAFYLAWPLALKVFEYLWGDRPIRGEEDTARAARRAGRPIEYQKNLDRGA